MNKKKLNLDKLTVESFITKVEHTGKTKLVGGSGTCRYESVIICEEPAPTVGCPAETFAIDIFGC